MTYLDEILTGPEWENHIIIVTCPACDGSGIYEGVDCVICGGLGSHQYVLFDVEIMENDTTPKEAR